MIRFIRGARGGQDAIGVYTFNVKDFRALAAHGFADKIAAP
jgi:hypothetical protein